MVGGCGGLAEGCWRLLGIPYGPVVWDKKYNKVHASPVHYHPA